MPRLKYEHRCASRRAVRTELELRADVRVVAKDLRRRESEGSSTYKGQSVEEDPMRKHITDLRNVRLAEGSINEAAGAVT